MKLNDNKQFYQRLSFWVSILFCLFFLVVANIMRFKFLVAQEPFVATQKAEPLQYVYFITFQSVNEDGARVKMMFLENELNPKYLPAVFSKIDEKNYQNIFVVHCGDQTNLKALQKFFDVRFENIPKQIDSCHFSEQLLEEKLKDNQTLSVLVLKENFKNKKALRAAQRSALKPDIHIVEIKHANTRL